MQTLFHFVKISALICLAVLSATAVATAPQPLTAAFFIAGLWIVSYYTIKFRKHITAFFNSTVPLKQYIAEQAELKKKIEQQQAKARELVLDSINAKPLTPQEHATWNELIANLDTNEK